MVRGSYYSTSRISGTPCEDGRAEVLILLVKQRENVENAGRVNKRCERVRGETIPVDCDVTYLSKDSRRGSMRESSGACRRINLSGRCLWSAKIAAVRSLAVVGRGFSVRGRGGSARLNSSRKKKGKNKKNGGRKSDRDENRKGQRVRKNWTERIYCNCNLKSQRLEICRIVQM